MIILMNQNEGKFEGNLKFGNWCIAAAVGHGYEKFHNFCLLRWCSKLASICDKRRWPWTFYPWNVLNGMTQNTYLTQFSRLLFISHLLIIKCRANPQIFFGKGPETFASLLPGFFRFIYMTWYNIHHYLQCLLYHRQCTMVPDYHQSVQTCQNPSLLHQAHHPASIAHSVHIVCQMHFI